MEMSEQAEEEDEWSEDLEWDEPVQSVQELAEKGIEAVPAIYIRPSPDRPTPCTADAEGSREGGAAAVPRHPRWANPDNRGSIPVIDLRGVVKQLQGSRRSGEGGGPMAEVARACEEWGFFQVVRHGIPREVLEGLHEAARAFFALPLEAKRAVRRTQENALGYNEQELTKNVRDWKEVFDMATAGSLELPDDFLGDPGVTTSVLNQWPPALPTLRRACEAYAKDAERLSFELLELISESLGVERYRLNEYFKDGTTMLRLNHYPVCPSPELALGVNRHKDGGALTVLLQDEVGGLQVRRKDGEWIDVKPDPFAPVINVGDMIQVFSNDKYHSVEHRVVVNEMRDRYSFPLFFNTRHSVTISPLPELTSEQHPPRYRPLHWGKYMKRKKDTNYKDLGVENLQIHHYAINSV